MRERITKVHVNYEFANGAYGLWLGAQRQGGGLLVADALTFSEREEGAYYAPPILLAEEEAQMLANALWDAGVRPQQARQSQGQSEAMADHLSDMRAIAFHKLGIIGGSKNG
jgi:hypothetical protein